MSDLNKVLLLGRLGADPVRRETKEGKPVTQFSLATSYRTKNNEEETQWHRVVCWGKLADLCAAHLTKGNQIFVEGAYRSKRFETQDGQSRLNFEVIADKIQFLGKTQKQKDESAEEVMAEAV